MPLVAKLMKGETVDFGYDAKDDDPQPQLVLSHKTAGVYKVGRYTNLNELPEGSIAMVGVYGPVMKFGDLCSYGSVDHAATMNRLASARNISGVIIDLDSPGGEAAGTALLCDSIRNLAKQKPVITVVDDGIAASAGMWIASAGDELYVTQKTDMVGSIGAYQTIADWYGYFEAEGLKVRDIYAPQSTDKNRDYKEALEGNDELIMADLKVLVDEFHASIKRNRGTRLTSDEWKTGKMYYTKEALRIGLIDGQKSLADVMKRMVALVQKRQSSNSNTMAFEKTLAAAKAEQFEVVDGGFLTEEGHLNNIEAKLVADEAAIADQATTIQQQQVSIDTLTTSGSALEQKLADANATIQQKDQEIAALNAKVTELGGKPAGATAVEEPEQDKQEKKGPAANDFAFQQEILKMVR